MTTTQLGLSDLSKISRTPRRWGIYCRVSKDRTGARLAVERQLEDIQPMIPEGDVWELYEDDDITAADLSKDRPDYRRLLADLRSGFITGVMVWHPDRLHRHPKELEEFLYVCEVKEKEDIFIEFRTLHAADYDLSTPGGRLGARVVGAAARSEWEMANKRKRRAIVQKAESGKHHGGGRRYGRNYDMSVREHEAAILRDVARRHLNGESLNSLADELNRRGERTPLSTEWNTGLLKRLVKNPDQIADSERGVMDEVIARHAGGLGEQLPELARELREERDVALPVNRTQWTAANLGRTLRAPHVNGERSHKGSRHQAQWEAILDEETYESLIALIDQPGRKSVGGSPKHEFAGLMKCGRCGHAMNVHYTAKGKRGWKCHQQSGGCGNVSRVAETKFPVVSLHAPDGFGALIRRLRGAMSSDRLGARAFVAGGYIRRIEAGTSTPSPELAVSLLRHLGLEVIQRDGVISFDAEGTSWRIPVRQEVAGEGLEPWLRQEFFAAMEEEGFLTGVSMLDKDEQKELLAELETARADKLEAEKARWAPGGGMRGLSHEAYEDIMGQYDTLIADLNRRLRAATPQAVIDLRDLVEQGALRETWNDLPLVNRRNALRWAISHVEVLPLGAGVKGYTPEQCYRITWNVR